MTEQPTGAIWLNESDVCSIEHLADVSGLSLDEVRDLVDSGVILPVRETEDPASFPLHYVVTVITARRLRDDFELDRRGVAVALMLVQRIRQLEAELVSTGAKS
jgi:chaperone modulatory protein CbpM